MSAPFQNPQMAQMAQQSQPAAANVLSPEEEAYVQLCGQAIAAGATAADEAAGAGDADVYLKMAQGVDYLVSALNQIKNGGKTPVGSAGPRIGQRA